MAAYEVRNLDTKRRRRDISVGIKSPRQKCVTVCAIKYDLVYGLLAILLASHSLRVSESFLFCQHRRMS